MKRFVFILLALLALSVACSVIVTAHPGRTDQYGGHWNHSTGEYHYHGTPDSSHSGGSSSGGTADRDWGDSSSSSGSSGSSHKSNAGDIIGTIIACVVLAPSFLFMLWGIVISPIIDKTKNRSQPKSITEETPTKPTENESVPPSTEQKLTTLTPLSTPPIPPPPPEEPSVSIPRPKIRGSEERFLSQASPSKPSTPTPRTVPNHHQQPSAPRKPLKDYPEILDYNVDFLTEWQVIAYAESISTSRGKRAVTEFYHYDDLTVHDEKKPYRVESGMVSFHRAQ
jgi:hypothetical protein